MALYLIGDVQGCDPAHCSGCWTRSTSRPAATTIVLLGDLVNRGPDSAAVLRRVQGYGASARSLLGNHDLHLLGVAHGARKAGRKDTLADMLAAPDREAMLDWLRHQHMALHMQIGGRDLLMVHAGVLPQWTMATRWRWRPRSNRCCAARSWAISAHDVRQRAGRMARHADRQCAAARDRQRADAAALLHASMA
jgi:hypothetical protein